MTFLVIKVLPSRNEELSSLFELFDCPHSINQPSFDVSVHCLEPGCPKLISDRLRMHAGIFLGY